MTGTVWNRAVIRGIERNRSDGGAGDEKGNKSIPSHNSDG